MGTIYSIRPESIARCKPFRDKFNGFLLLVVTYLGFWAVYKFITRHRIRDEERLKVGTVSDRTRIVQVDSAATDCRRALLKLKEAHWAIPTLHHYLELARIGSSPPRLQGDLSHRKTLSGQL